MRNLMQADDLINQQNETNQILLPGDACLTQCNTGIEIKSICEYKEYDASSC